MGLPRAAGLAAALRASARAGAPSAAGSAASPARRTTARTRSVGRREGWGTGPAPRTSSASTSGSRVWPQCRSAWRYAANHPCCCPLSLIALGPEQVYAVLALGSLSAVALMRSEPKEDQAQTPQQVHKQLEESGHFEQCSASKCLRPPFGRAFVYVAKASLTKGAGAQRTRSTSSSRSA